MLKFPFRNKAFEAIAALAARLGAVMVFAPLDGAPLTVEIETSTPGTYIAINGVDKYSRRSGRASRKQSVFGQVNQISSTGVLAETITLSGITDIADPGILRLLAMKAGDLQGSVRIKFDGTNGFTQPVKVTSLDTDADPDDFQTFSTNLETMAAAVLVGTGPIL
jgi:hypothetical protein